MRTAVFAVLFAFSAACLAAQPAPVPEATLKEWGETIDYGIDTQIIDVVKKIKDSGDSAFNVKLTGVLAKSVNVELRKAILGLFTDEKYAGAEEAAYTILADYENEDADVLRALVSYLAEIKSKRSLEYMLKLADSDDGVVAYSAIAAVGRMGDQSMADTLLKKLRDPEMKPDRKPAIITALGDMKAAAALPELLKILGNREEDHVWRMYAAESLGKIGDASALPVLKKALGENDPLLKASVAGALGRFELGQVQDVLLECLKDSYWKVRVAACQGLARPGAAKAVDILIYKVKNDPETPVKAEAVRALAAIGSEAGFAFFRSYLLDRGKPSDMRQLAFSTLLEKNLTADTAATVEAFLKQEWDGTSGLLEWAAQKLSRTSSALVKKSLAMLLDHPNSAVKIVAIRGVVLNRFTDLRGKLEDIEKRDPLEQVRQEAKAALGKF
jgi:HEAT repeat protein